MFTPIGRIPILTNVFQRGWNHQLGIHIQDDQVFLSNMIRQNWVSYFEEADNGVPIREHIHEAFGFARVFG